MPNFDLQVAVAETVKDLLGDTLEHRKATAAAITPDGRVSPQAVAGALPWQAHDGAIEGEVETGSNRLRWHFPQGGIIRQVSFDVRTPPSGGGLEFTLSGGTTTERLSLQAGQTRGVTNTNIVMPAGSWAQVNILSANGAADLAVSLQYVSAGTGSTSSGGSGGGGGGGTISVISVNGQTGVVVLDADDINDTSTSHKFVSSDEKAKLADFEPSDYALASSLSLVATSGDYADLTGKPTLGTAAAMSAGSFATAAQGGRADTAVQPGDLGDLAAKDSVAVSDIAASGTPGSTTYLRGDGNWSTPPSGGGGGAVDSVNGQTGVVVLDADDIDDGSTTHKFLTAADLSDIASAVQPGDLATVATTGDYDDLSGKPTLYTQSEVDALIALRKPKRGNSWSGQTVSTAGDYAMTSQTALLTFSNLTPGESYELSWTVNHNWWTSAAATAQVGVRITDAAGDTFSFGMVRQMRHTGAVGSTEAERSWSYSATVTARSNGTVQVCPAVRWASGTTYFQDRFIVARID